MTVPLRTNYNDGGATPVATEVTAADLNNISQVVNGHDTSINSLSSGLVTANTNITTLQNLPAGLRTIAGAYRPLQGVRTDITSTFTAGASYASGGLISWTTAYPGKFRICGTNPTGIFSNAYCYNNNTGLGSGYPNPVVVEFWTNAADLRIHLAASTSTPEDCWALCDDQRISAGWMHATPMDGSGITTWALTQSAQAYHKWRICVSTLLAGVSVESTAHIVPTTGAPKIAVIGDSLTAGRVTIGNAISSGVNAIIAAGTSWGELEQVTGVDVWRNAISGTGYVNDNSIGTTGPYGSTTRMTALSQYPPMDVVVCFGSDNDNYANPSPVVTAAQACWAAIKTAQPTAALVVIGVQNSFPSGSQLYNVNIALKTAAQSSQAVSAFIDICSGYPVIYGTGNTTTPTGDGNADVFTDGLSNHPTHLGHRAWGQELAKLVGTIGIPFNKMMPTIIIDRYGEPAASPAWQTTSANTASSANTTAGANVPTGVSAGDIIVNIMTILTAGAITVTPPTGWAQLGTTIVNSAAGMQTQVWWKRATGSDTGVYSFTLSTSQIWTCDFMRYNGAIASGSPFDGITTGVNTTAAAATPALSLTTTGANRLVVWFAISGNAAAANLTAPYVNSEWSGTRSKVCDNIQTAASSTGSVSGPTSRSGGDVFNTVMYALKAS